MSDVVVAGGSGGLGSATVRALAREWRIVYSYRENAARAAALREYGTALRADLSHSDDRRTLLDAAPALYGLVVFSGDASRVKEPGELEAAMRRSHEVNYLGPVLLARETAARMKSMSTEGSIVLISTMQAVSVFTGSTAYAAQKAALIQSARILAKEYRGKTNIRVNVVCPGVNQAGMAEASIASGKYDAYIRNDVVSRFGRAEDVALAVRFFLEPDNYVTGQVLTVDGGLTL